MFFMVVLQISLHSVRYILQFVIKNFHTIVLTFFFSQSTLFVISRFVLSKRQARKLQTRNYLQAG